jgi:hypothetical protein
VVLGTAEPKGGGQQFLGEGPKPKDHIPIQPTVRTRSVERRGEGRRRWIPKKSGTAPGTLAKSAAKIYEASSRKGKIFADPDIYFVIRLSQSFRSSLMRKVLEKLSLDIVEVISENLAKARIPKSSYSIFLENLEKHASYIVEIKETTLEEKIESLLLASLEANPEKTFPVNIEISRLRQGQLLNQLIKGISSYVESSRGKIEEAYRSERFVLLAGEILGKSIHEIAEDIDAINRVNLTSPVRFSSVASSFDGGPSFRQSASIQPILRASTVVGATNLPPVCVIDTGLHENHALIKPFVIGKLDLVQSPTPCQDVRGHGTRVAGLAIYEGDVSARKPVCGVIGVKVFRDGVESTARLISYLHDAVQSFQTDCKVFNLSFASDGPDPLASRALDDLAYQRRVLFVAAAGNIDPDVIAGDLVAGYGYPNYLTRHHIFFPGDCYNAITVGSLASKTSNLAREKWPSPFTRAKPPSISKMAPEVLAIGGNAQTSNQSGQITIESTGYGVVSTTIDGGLGEDVGTSYSCPVVSSILSQLQRKYPDHWPCLYKALLASGAEELANDSGEAFHEDIQGYGAVKKPETIYSYSWRANLYAESQFELGDTSKYHQYSILFPDNADRIRISLCCEVEPLLVGRKLPYWLSVRFHKSGTQSKSLSRPAIEKPHGKSNIKVYEQPVSRGGKGKWSVYVFPHLDSAMYADERLRKGMLRYGIVITVLSDRRREVYAPINRYNKTLSPIRPLVAPARSRRAIEAVAR